MILSIVGTRRRHNSFVKKLIRSIIEDICPTKIVSGGCPKGADLFAKELAIEMNIEYQEFPPDIKENMNYYDRVKEYYARNKQIAENCDKLLAVVSENRKGGTENTIKHFLKDNSEENLILI